MKRILVFPILFLMVFSVTLPLSANPKAFEDSLPLRKGMRLSFQCSFGRFGHKKDPWTISIVKTNFPESLTYTWTRTAKKKQTSGTRTLIDLKTGRNFSPRFRNNELISTSDTVPWVSVKILKELRESNKAPDFREGGSGVVRWRASTLKNLEKVIYPVFLNGKPVAFHAFRVNKNMIIWNNLQNPLVLEYKPLGIPLITNTVGWNIREIDF